MKRLTNYLKKRVTIMFVPHQLLKLPVKITVTFSFLFFVILCWTGTTIWVGYNLKERLQYSTMTMDLKTMKSMFSMHLEEMQKAYKLLNDVNDKDKELRKILKIPQSKYSDMSGGPTLRDEKYFQKLSEGKLDELTVSDINYQVQTITKFAKTRLDSINEITGNINEQRLKYRACPNTLPCVGNYTNINFGYRIHPITKEYEFHKGIDVGNKKGTKIVATADGIVREADWVGGYGRLVVLEHKYGYETRYGHLSKICVRKGDRVVRGSLVGLMGDTGLATCSHLHYEVRRNSDPVNPRRYLAKDVYFSFPNN